MVWFIKSGLNTNSASHSWYNVHSWYFSYKYEAAIKDLGRLSATMRRRVKPVRAGGIFFVVSLWLVAFIIIVLSWIGGAVASVTTPHVAYATLTTPVRERPGATSACPLGSYPSSPFSSGAGPGCVLCAHNGDHPLCAHLPLGEPAGPPVNVVRQWKRGTRRKQRIAFSDVMGSMIGERHTLRKPPRQVKKPVTLPKKPRLDVRHHVLKNLKRWQHKNHRARRTTHNTFYKHREGDTDKLPGGNSVQDHVQQLYDKIESSTKATDVNEHSIGTKSVGNYGGDKVAVPRDEVGETVGGGARKLLSFDEAAEDAASGNFSLPLGTVAVLGSKCLNSSAVRVELTVSPQTVVVGCDEHCVVHTRHDCFHDYQSGNSSNAYQCQHVDVVGLSRTWVDLLMHTELSADFLNSTMNTSLPPALETAVDEYLQERDVLVDTDDTPVNETILAHGVRLHLPPLYPRPVRTGVNVSTSASGGCGGLFAASWTPLRAQLEWLFTQHEKGDAALAHPTLHTDNPAQLVQHSATRDPVLGENYVLRLSAEPGVRIARIVTADTVSVRAMQLLSVAKTREDVIDVCRKFTTSCVLREHTHIPTSNGWPAFSWLHGSNVVQGTPHMLWVVDLQRTPECTAQVGSWLLASYPLAKDNLRLTALFSATAVRWCQDPQPMVLVKPGFAWPRLLRSSPVQSQWTLTFVELQQYGEW